MECKYIKGKKGIRWIGELIDTLWNVNVIIDKYDCVVAGHELIDTLWNVNIEKQNKENKDSTELIDTLWNVNDFLKYVQKEFDKN